MDRQPPRIEEIEHTADWAIRVRAPDLAGLFAGAAQGMFGLLAELSQVSPERQIEVDLAAIDLETLLVDWLNELLYRAEEDGIVFAVFAVDVHEDSGGARLRAHVTGGRPARPLLKAIKAATFNGLHVVHDAGGVRTDLVFDV